MHAELHPSHASVHDFKLGSKWYLEARAEIPGADLVERIPIQVFLTPNDGSVFG